ncbi:MAG: Wzz/FepE/Etk N-terminal domain-containing protein [Hyphomicrobium sp.]
MRARAETYEIAEDGAGALSVDRAIAAIRKRAKFVVALPILAAAAVAALVVMMPNRYDASAIIQIDPRQKSIAKVDTVVSDLTGDQPTIESEVEIVRSRPIVLSVIETLDLRNDPEFASPGLFDRLKRILGFAANAAGEPVLQRAPLRPHDQIGDLINMDAPGQSAPERDEVAAAVYDRLKVMRVRNTLLIDVRFSASDAIKSARIANTIAEVYLKDQLDSKKRAAATATRLLEEKLDQMRLKVSEAERKVEQWKALNGVFDSEGQILSEKHMARLMEQTVIARNSTSEARAKFEQAQKLARLGDGGTAIVEVLQSHTIRLLKEQLGNATRKNAELATKYGPRHPEILKSRAEVGEAQSQLQSEINRLVENLKNEAEVAEARERQLSQSLAQLKEQQIISKEDGVALKDLEREAATSKHLFEALLVRYKETAETQEFQLPDARIIEKADAPLFPASPKRKQLVIMAAGGGLVLALALAVLFELMAPGIVRSDDIERALDVPHLSSVPAPSVDGGAIPPEKAVRLMVAEPASVYADAIRTARREVDMRRETAGPRIILVASAMPGEGAEVVASNLAHHFAMSGGKPLLIDGDFRLQTLTRHLAPQRSTGLLDQLATKRTPEAVVLKDGMTGLHFLPAAGPAPAMISIPEALSSSRMHEALSALKERFDTVILSAPPLMPVLDGRILADYADQIVFVMTWQRTPKQIVKRAMRLLGANESKIAGVILNDVADDAFEDRSGYAATVARQGSTGRRSFDGRDAA